MNPVYILAAILIFGVLIAVHELGHFVAAKLCGVRVNEFSIGMGPVLWQREKGETRYSFRLLPIGGYCAMEGEDEDSGDSHSLVRQGFWKQFIILAAGSATYFLAGFLII
ncbi:MAG: site-2 protease family protein, partial [Oscillibacter sp.]